MMRHLKLLARGRTGSRDLPYDDAADMAGAILDGTASEAQTAAALTALRLKPETAVELDAFISALRQRTQAVTLPAALRARSVVVAGGPEGRESFNASLGASLLCSLAGMPTLIQGSEPMPPREGSGVSQLLGAFGVQRGATEEPELAASELQRLGIAYLDTESWCPSLGRLRRLRSELGFRTVLHLAERFLQPLGADQLMVGLPHVPALERVRSLAGSLGQTRVVAVVGLDGSEDLPTHKPVQISVLEGGLVRELSLDAADLGLAAQPRRGLSLAQQRACIAAVLGGEAGAEVEVERRQVLWNTACRLWLFGQALSLGEGLEQAQDLLQTGKGLTLLLRWARSQPQGQELRS